VEFQPGFIPLIIKGLLNGLFGLWLGGIAFSFLTFWVWVILVILLAVLAIRGRARHAGILLLLLAILLAVFLIATGMGGYSGMLTGVLVMGMTNMLEYSSGWLWLVVAALVALGALLLLTRQEWRVATRVFFLVLALVFLFVGILANKFLNGRMKDVNPVLAVLPNDWLNAEYKGINVGPIPRGTPVNLIMNLDPDKRDKVGPALVALLRAMGEIKKKDLSGEEAYKVLASQAGPALMAASKVPDFVLDRGHWFGESLTDADKEALIAFLKTL
jgi:hypothetical protein